MQTLAAESDPRPSSPVDPYLVFDQDIIRFENSGQRLKVSERPRLLLDLTGQVTKEDQFPFATGGFADVWLGTWNTVDRCHLVRSHFFLSATLGFHTNKIKGRHQGDSRFCERRQG